VGTATSYCRALNLRYTFNAMNQLTAISDADESQYGATVTCDANGNITQVTGSGAHHGGGLIGDWTSPLPTGTSPRAREHADDRLHYRRQRTRRKYE